MQNFLPKNYLPSTLEPILKNSEGNKQGSRRKCMRKSNQGFGRKKDGNHGKFISSNLVIFS